MIYVTFPAVVSDEKCTKLPSAAFRINFALMRFYAGQQNASRVLAMAGRPSVRPFVRPSHSEFVSKRCRLESQNPHCGLLQIL